MHPMTWHRHARRLNRRAHRHGGFGPWSERGRFFGPGEVRLALLALLGEGAGHGYELMRRLEDRSEGTYRASAGTIYPTLQQLEDEGLAASEEREGKRVYRLTDAGRAELERRQEAVKRIWRRAEDWGSWSGVDDPDAAELLRPGLRLVKAALHAAARSDDPERLDAIRQILERAREEIAALR
jgi:DNA-binding PadR family transcriptional regulator